MIHHVKLIAINLKNLSYSFTCSSVLPNRTSITHYSKLNNTKNNRFHNTGLRNTPDFNSIAYSLRHVHSRTLISTLHPSPHHPSVSCSTVYNNTNMLCTRTNMLYTNTTMLYTHTNMLYTVHSY